MGNDKDGKEVAKGSKALSPRKEPRTLKFAEKGVKTGSDFANFMSCLMSDLIDGRVTPQVGNATCNAGGKLLKIVDMQYKYGTVGDSKKNRRTLSLTMEEDEDETTDTEEETPVPSGTKKVKFGDGDVLVVTKGKKKVG